MPKVVNILFAVFTVIPLYKFTENEFKTKEGAFFVALTYLFIPIVLRNSFNVLSGIPFAFFVALAMFFLSEGRKSGQSVKYGILAGLAMTIAGGFRYEAWLLIAVFTLILLLQKQWKMVIFFWAFAMIFPVIWMTGSYMEYGDIFYGSHGAYRWNVLLMGVNDTWAWRKIAWRLLYFPLTYIIVMTPVVAGAAVYYFAKLFKSDTLEKNMVSWSLPFLVLMGTFIYKAYNGTLLLQPRFVLSLILTSLPFYSLTFRDLAYRKVKRIVAVAVIILLIPYAYLVSGIIYPYSGIQKIQAFPQIKDKTTLELLEIIRDKTKDDKQQTLIQDFIGWENTYFIGLRCGLTPDHVFFVTGAPHAKVYASEMAKVIEKNDSGILVKKTHSKLDKHIHFLNDTLIEMRKVSRYMVLKPVFRKKNIVLYTYTFGGKAPAIYYEDRMLFNKHKNEVFQLESNIKNNKDWYKSTISQARERGLAVDTMLRLNAIYMLKQKQKKKLF